MKTNKFRFPILVTIISVSGLSQGMLLPLLAILLENNGVSSTVNGLHATGLYIGILLASPFLEAPLRRFGYKPLIIVGGITVIVSLILFTVWENLIFWFVLRLLIGIGDQALHFSTQTWITAFSPVNKRGRNISFYGLSFGIGFAVGPLLTRLIEINMNLPFILCSALSLLAWVGVFKLTNEFPEQVQKEESYSIRSTVGGFGKVLKYAWGPLLPALCYGVLEASINGNFPVYGLRIGFDVEVLPIMISSFSIGAIVFQLPIGILSDKFGRGNVLKVAFSIGSLMFVLAGIFEYSVILIMTLLFIAGMLLGSTYSLSIAYLTDTIPVYLLPTGNLLISICFSLGSISGPFIGGLAIDYLPNISFFHIISGIIVMILILLVLYRPKISVDGKSMDIETSSEKAM